MENRFLIENKTIYTIAGVVMCLQGVCGVSLVTSGVSSMGYMINYYDYMFGAISMFLVGINILCGLVILAAYILTGVAVLCRKNELAAYGIAACGLSYVLVIIRDIISAACYGISGTLFVNILCLAVFVFLAAALLTQSSDLKNIIVRYNLICCIAPIIIFIITLMVSRYYFSAGNVMLSVVETLAQIAAIIITGTLLSREADSNNAEMDPWTRGNAAPENGGMNSSMNNNMNSGAGNNPGSSADISGGSPAFNSNMSVQRPDGYRSVPLVIIFSIITIGIYMLYWVYKVSEKVNRELKNGKSPTVQLLLYMFVPFYALYWYYTTSENIGVYAALKKKTVNNSLGVIDLLLALFGLAIVAVALMQDAINKIVGEYEGYSYQQNCAVDGAAVNGGTVNSGVGAGSANNGNFAGGVGAGYSYSETQTAASAKGQWQSEPQTDEEPLDAVFEKVPESDEGVKEPENATENVPEAEPESVKKPETVSAPEKKEEAVCEDAAPAASGEIKLHYDELKKLKELLDEQIITQEEFEQLKKKFI